MEIHQGGYYHIYNRSNNSETVFKSPENYVFFLSKYRKYLERSLDTIAYCLMPNHFHFLVFVRSEEIAGIKNAFGLLQSSYTKAINRRYHRNGSLFQQHAKAKLIDRDESLLTLIAYIHQNPIRRGLAEKLADWEYSSYREYLGLCKSTFVSKSYIQEYFSSIEDFKEFSEEMVASTEEF
jgi:putative transposase